MYRLLIITALLFTVTQPVRAQGVQADFVEPNLFLLSDEDADETNPTPGAPTDATLDSNPVRQTSSASAGPHGPILPATGEPSIHAANPLPSEALYPDHSTDPNQPLLMTQPMPETAPTPMASPSPGEGNATYGDSIFNESVLQPSAGAACGPSIGCSSPGGVYQPRMWARAEVILWWAASARLPDLLTGNPVGIDDEQIGLPSEPTTQSLIGGKIAGDLRAGGQVRGGVWLDPCRRWGIQGDFLWLGSARDVSYFESVGDPILARPFFNTDPSVNGPDGQVIGLDGVVNGSFRTSASSNMWSAAPTLRRNIQRCCNKGCPQIAHSVDFLLGYRFLRFEETFRAVENIQPTLDFYADGTTIEIRDMVSTENNLHGVEFGLSVRRQVDDWFVEIDTLAMIGNNSTLYSLNGSTTADVPNVSRQSIPGGFLVRPENIGTYRDNHNIVVPQLRFRIGRCITSRLRADVGYNFLYLSHILRPYQFLTTTFDGNTLATTPTNVGTVQPAAIYESLVMHGLSVGLTYDF